jgi:hypothetical protein
MRSEITMPTWIFVVITLALVVAPLLARFDQNRKTTRRLQDAHNCAHFEVDAKTGKTTRVVTCATCKESE